MDIQVKDGGLFIAPIDEGPPKSWGEEFAKAVGSDNQIDENPFDGIENDFDKEEWSW